MGGPGQVFRDDAQSSKVILVTGGFGGRGKEIAQALAVRKAAVHICCCRLNSGGEAGS